MALSLNRINTNVQEEVVLLEHSTAEPIL